MIGAQFGKHLICLLKFPDAAAESLGETAGEGYCHDTMGFITAFAWPLNKTNAELD